jgi:protocatechuate 3,4-dioxygenase beta subunit
VLLTLLRKTKSAVGSGFDTPRTTAPDAGGQFRFQNIPPGEYSLMGEARGYLRLAEFTNWQPRRSGTVLSLAAGQKLSGIVLRLVPSAAVSGRIVDEDGDPLKSVQVQLWRITYFPGRRALTTANAERSSTDDRGVYRVAGITPGKYYLSAAPSGDVPNWPPDDARYVQAFYPGTLDPAVAAPIDVAPGAELENIGFKLSKVQTVHVGGRVLSAAAADVSLSPESIVSNSHYSTSSILPDGRFDFDGVLPGTYNLLVRIREGEHRGWAYRPLTVGPTGVDGLTLSLNPGASITFRMRVDGGGGAADLSKLAIQLWPVDQGPALTYSEAPTKDGTFKIDDIAPGRYRVAPSMAPAGFYLKTVRSENGNLSGRILDLTVGAPAQVEALFSPKAASVTGTVFFSGSESPAPEATVVLIPQEKERREDLSAYQRTTTDDFGRFTIGGLPPGEYRAFAWESVDSFNRIYMDPEFIGPLESKGSAVTLAESDRADIKLTLITDYAR